MEYTLVLGVDRKHLAQLQLTYPTWIRHKPYLESCPLVVFFDDRGEERVTISDVKRVIGDREFTCVGWPWSEEISDYPPGNDKWTNSQRYKMLSGFVHVAAKYVKTEYWLKLDTDTVAVGVPNWVDPTWFDGEPAIVAQSWGYTKPADQMARLDQWCEREGISVWTPPLNLFPDPPESDRVKHSRIISWCGFFSRKLTRNCAEIARATCGEGKLPVPSQDGYMWYLARRGGEPIVRASMKSRGWEHWHTMSNIRSAVERSFRLPTSLPSSSSEIL